MNNLTISGNLVRDPDIRTSASGTEWATFTVAVNTREKKDDVWVDVPSFFDCKAFGRLVGVVMKLSKGSKVVVCGPMKQEAYTDKKSGEQRKAWRVTADDIVIMAATATVAGAGERVTATYEEPGTYADEPLPF